MIVVADETGKPERFEDDRPERATGVETVVYEENGRWAVDIVVLFPSSVVRRQIDTFPTRRRAEISANLIRRGAERDIDTPGVIDTDD